MTPSQALKKYFGYDSFRPGQEAVIHNILVGRDTLGIMPTGSGKSVCYLIPAVLLDGLTVVISPLISLMKDQVDTLNALGIHAEFLNSSQTLSEQQQILSAIDSGFVKVLYIAPERLDNAGFLAYLRQCPIQLLAVDEAHCVSHWGHDFRPSYLLVKDTLLSLPSRPKYAAFTATATRQVETDIIDLLGLEQPELVKTGFDRPNLFFSVVKPADKYAHLTDIIEQETLSGNPVLIYAATRKSVDSIQSRLTKAGWPTAKYHAGMDEESRRQNQDLFANDKVSIMAATNAFGMGIDKSNVRHVVHYNMPKDLESYYQEAGRAGRDGAPAKCTLLFSAGDIVTARYFIAQSEADSQAIAHEKLKQMSNYCNTGQCLRKYILSYFGDTAPEQCENCINCTGAELFDITLEAQKILSCIRRMKESYGQATVCKVLKGSKEARILSLGFDKLSTYGIMSGYATEYIRDVIHFLIAEQYLELCGDEFPILRLTAAALPVLKGEARIMMKQSVPTGQKASAATKSAKKRGAAAKAEAADSELFAQLKMLRLSIAREEGVPPFVVFSDKTLIDMCTKYPINKGEFLNVSGVGEFKAEKYAERFLSEITKYVFEHNIRSL